MLIWIDIDEVLCETLEYALAFFGGKVAGFPLKKEEVSDYYLPNIPGYETLAHEDAINFFIESLRSERTLEELKPVAGASAVLKKWKEAGHRFHAITARGEPMRPSTEAWLEKHFPGLFDTITFCNHYREEYPTYTKEEICQKENIQLFVEDNPKYAISLEAQGVEVYLLAKPWNASFQEAEHPKIHKVAGREAIARS